jgi:hypothetical protein
MPLTIVETPGAANANSFATEAEATAYLEYRLNASAYVAGSDDAKKALVEATREISAMDFKGDRTDEVQALSWPRKYVPDPDYPKAETGLAAPDLGLVVTYYDDDVIPVRVKEATIELALEFLKAGSSDIAAQDSQQNVIRKKTDVLETEYSDPVTRNIGLARFPRVVNRLTPLLADTAVSGGLEIIRT